jgi:hypothetical protein
MRGAIPPLSQYAFMAWCLVKHRDNFAFYVLKIIAMNDAPTENVKFRKKLVSVSGQKMWTNLSVSVSADTTIKRGEGKESPIQ